MQLRVTFALIACLASVTSLTQAQMSDGERKAAARAAYTEGVELQDKGKPSEALARFEAAEKLFDAPTHVLRIAECQALTGKLVEASETYETLIRKTLPPSSPDAFVQAQEQGKAELTALRPRIPTMRVTLKPEAPTLQNVQITVNEKQMPSELLGIARPVNPGAYRLTATATGWATPTPQAVEVQEKEQKNVELVLRQGATLAPVVLGPPGARPSPPEVPPPSEQAKPKPKESPSTTGLLLGVRAGFWVPGGDVDKTTKFSNYATAGPGFGLDVIGRFARLFLIGGTFEFASLGVPDSSVPQFKKAEVGTRSTYFGLLAGIMPNVDKVTFVADAGAGLRTVSQSVTGVTAVNGVTSPTSITSINIKSTESYSGLELAINAGISIPAGPMRIVPKAGVAFGQFTARKCELGSATANDITGCTVTGSTDVEKSGHTVFNVVVGIYYHVDFAKKSATASRSFFTTASN